MGNPPGLETPRFNFSQQISAAAHLFLRLEGGGRWGLLTEGVGAGELFLVRFVDLVNQYNAILRYCSCCTPYSAIPFRGQLDVRYPPLFQPAPKYHAKGCSRSSVDTANTGFAAFESFSSCEFRVSIARTPFSATLWRSPLILFCMQGNVNAIGVYMGVIAR